MSRKVSCYYPNCLLTIPIQTLVTLKIISFQPHRPAFTHDNIQGGGEP